MPWSKILSKWNLTNQEARCLQFRRLGCSGEVATYGGIVEPIVTGERTDWNETAPHLGFCLRTFPEPTMTHNIHGKPRLINPAAREGALGIPIPVTYYENMNSEDYWDVQVKKFRMNGALLPPQVVDGIVFPKDPDDPDEGYEWATISEDDVQIQRDLERYSMQTLTAMTPEQRAEHAIAMKREMVASIHPML